MRRLIEQFTDPGDLILDPFAGAGTTLRAAYDLGRRAIGIEIDPTFAARAVERFQQAPLPLTYVVTPTTTPTMWDVD